MMTLIEIMARSVGARPQQNKNCDVEYLMSADALKAFEALVRADEREACARMCDDIDAEYEGEDVLASWIATAIRARGETK